MFKRQCPGCGMRKSFSSKHCMKCRVYHMSVKKECVICKGQAIGPHFPSIRGRWHMYLEGRKTGHKEI